MLANCKMQNWILINNGGIGHAIFMQLPCSAYLRLNFLPLINFAYIPRKIFFSALRASVWSKNSGGGGGGLPGPLPWIRYCPYCVHFVQSERVTNITIKLPLVSDKRHCFSPSSVLGRFLSGDRSLFHVEVSASSARIRSLSPVEIPPHADGVSMPEKKFKHLVYRI